MADQTKAAPQGAGFRFRDTTRAPFTTTVRLRFDRLGSTVSAQSADISMEGMFVKTEEPRPVGTLVQFEFDVDNPESQDGTNDVVQGLGDVVWVRANGGPTKPSGMGIQFRYVDAQSREHVYRIVSNFIQQISGDGSSQSVPDPAGGANRVEAKSVEEKVEKKSVKEKSGQLGTLQPLAEAFTHDDGQLSSATIAAPLASLPGWNETTTDGDSAGPARGGEADRDLGARDSELANSGLGDFGPGDVVDFDQTVDIDDPKLETATETGSPGLAEAQRLPPPPPIGTSGGPFGSLLSPEGADAEAPLSADEPGLFDSLTAPNPVPVQGAHSGSFSLSVPSLQDEDDGNGVSTTSATESPDEALKSLRRDTFSGAPATSFATAGSNDLEVSTADEPIEVDAVFERELSGPEFDGPSLRPIEPYSPEPNTAEGAGGYYGGAGASARSRSMLPLLVVAVLAAIAIAAYFTKPWQYLSSIGTGDASIAETESPVTSAQPEIPGSQPVPTSIQNELEQQPIDSLDSEGAASKLEDSVGDSTGQVTTEPVPATSPDPGADQSSLPSTVAAPGNGQRQLSAFAIADLADRTQVRIVASTPIRENEYSTVVLSNPPRFLVKIEGVNQPFSVSDRSARFVSVRTGLHQVDGRSELHVVFDMTTAGFVADVRLDQGELLVSLR